MPFPLTVTDNFNRANGAPGGLWTDDPDGEDTPQFTISSNQLVGGLANAWMYYDLGLGAFCEASIKVGALSAGALELEAIIDAGTAAWGGYAVSTDTVNSQLFRYEPGSGGAVFDELDTIAGSFSASDEMGIRVLPGGLIEFWSKPAAGSWGKIGEATDPDPIVGDMKIALYTAQTSTAIEDFSVASIAAGGGMLPFFRRRRKE